MPRRNGIFRLNGGRPILILLRSLEGAAPVPPDGDMDVCDRLDQYAVGRGVHLGNGSLPPLYWAIVLFGQGAGGASLAASEAADANRREAAAIQRHGYRFAPHRGRDGKAMSAGLVLIMLLAWAYLMGSTVAALRFARRPIRPATERAPVSVLKPLHGTEPGLYENLRSFVEQEYPKFQIVFGVRRSADAALPVAREVVRDCPGRDIAIVVDPHATGSNLKVANLENMLPAAKYDLIVIADSDMRVDADYLAAVTAALQVPRAGVVTCLYKGMPSSGLWSRLGAMHINFAFLPSALLGEALKTGGGCFGATIALRRGVLQRIGGFARIRDELADDHRLGDAVRELGLALVLSPYIVENHVAELSFARLWRHELRWARTVRAMAPCGFAGSIITHTFVLSLVVAAAAGFASIACWLALASCLMRWIAAALIARRLALSTEGLWLLPLRDVLSFAVFLVSFCGRSVLWRDQLFRVEPGGRMSVEGDKPV